MARLRWHVPANLSGERLDKVVALAPCEHALTRSRARVLVETGRISLDGRRVTLSSARVRGGELLELRGNAASLVSQMMRSSRSALLAPLHVLHEDEAVLAVDKPAGVPSEPTRDPTRESVLGLLRAGRAAGAGETLGLPHRLDRDTSGVLLVAKGPQALARLGASFEARETRKVYVALVHGVLAHDELRLESFLAPAGSRRGEAVMAAVRAGGKKAITLVRVLSRSAVTTLVECELLTGRTHQARVQLAGAGHVIVGDELYGAPLGEHARVGRHLLHARLLEVPHPARAGERLRIESAVPEEFAAPGRRAPRGPPLRAPG